jgi:hypothetical protein
MPALTRFLVRGVLAAPPAVFLELQLSGRSLFVFRGYVVATLTLAAL